MHEIPVYLFTGFLESGKTKFIQDTFEDKRFHNGEPTLLLVCEEGEEEYDASRFAGPNVTIRVVEEESWLTPDRLAAAAKRCNAKRVVIEYNGMWQLSSLYNAMPYNWSVYQEVMFADANTFLSYNTNMRSLVVDKLQGCEMVIFNRCKQELDKLPLHKIVRGISRRADIAYDYETGEVEYDDIEDPLPFDVEADIIEIADIDYALWYRDLSEEQDKYVGKTVRFKGIVAADGKLPKDTFVIGRHIMTCCADDIRYGGLIAIWESGEKVNTRDWLDVTAEVAVEYNKAYRGKGPVLKIKSAQHSTPPKEEVVTFY